MSRYANILLARNTDRLFTYRIPDALLTRVQVGKTVMVPFRNKPMQGFVVELTGETDLTSLREINDVADDVPAIFNELHVSLARKIAGHYCCPFLAALYLYLPPGMDKKNKKVAQDTVKIAMFGLPPTEVAVLLKEYEGNRRYANMACVIRDILRNGGTLPVSDVRHQTSLRTLVKKGVVAIDEVQVSRAFILSDAVAPKSQVALTEQQKAVVEGITGSDKQFFLLHGVTGSGKTEVYMEIIDHALEQGRSAVMLVPEISLTPQTVARFHRRFGGRIAVLHSSLTGKERKREWYRVLHGEARVVIGARSALFAPLTDIGVIIIDEEHETSYKQESSPRYHAVTVAGWFARAFGAKLVLGSATPSIERYFFARSGYLELFELPQQVFPTSPPVIDIVDMRKEGGSGRTGTFSSFLVQAVREVLERKEQVLLFLNRRGMTPFVICRSCGYKLTCPNCEVTLTLHNDSKLHCHYCGYRRPNKPICPECQSEHFRYFGTGTQKIETELRSFFPHARMLRMDRDTTRSLGSMEAVLKRFSTGDADILIGTQMIAKGHDFSNVGLVGVVSADIALNLPDFRAAERTYTLLKQVAGRTGRRGVPGRVVVQTYAPDNYAIAALGQNNYDSFYEQEIELRKQLFYPPFMRMGRIILQSRNEQALQELVRKIEAMVRKMTGKEVTVLGPVLAPITKIASKERWHLFVKSKTIHGIHNVVKLLEPIVRVHEKNVQWQIDIDPVNML